MKTRSKKSIGGASRFIRKAIAAGKTPAQVKAEAIARWPKFAKKSERPFLTKRIQIAKHLAAHRHAHN